MESEAASTMWDILWQNFVEQVSPPSYSTNFGPLSFSAQKRNRSLFRSLSRSVWSVRREIKIKRRGEPREREGKRRVPPKVDGVDGNVGRANSSGKFNLRSKRGREEGRAGREGGPFSNLQRAKYACEKSRDWDELGEERREDKNWISGPRFNKRLDDPLNNTTNHPSNHPTKGLFGTGGQSPFYF